MRAAPFGVLASLGIGAFVANAHGGGSGWDIKRQPWGSSTQQWSESAQWSEEWKWTANQQLPAAPGSAWQFSQSNTIAPPLPAGSSAQGKWTWIPSPGSAGFFWSYSSSASSIPSSSQGLGAAPGLPWQFSQSNTTPPPLPAGQSVGSWKWVSGPSGGYYWSFIPAPKQDLPTPPGTAWQFSQSNQVAPALPAGSSSGSWKWISAPSGGGYYWSFIAGPKQNLPPAPGTAWIFSTSSTTAPPLPAGASGSGTWKWVSSPDGKGYYWSFISSGGSKTPQQKLPDPPTGGSGWIYSTSIKPPALPVGASPSGSWKWITSPDGKGYYWSYISSPSPQIPEQKLPDPPAGGSGWIYSPSSTTPPALPAGASPTVSWKWVSSPDGKGYYWSYISSPSPEIPEQKLPEPPTGGSQWIFTTSSTTPPPKPAGSSSTGSWKWVSAPNGNGYYWSYLSSPPSPQEQLPPPQSGSTEWIFSPSKTTPPALPQGISGTSGSWKWLSAPNGNGYYWSFTPSSPSSQQLPSPKPGSTGWIFSPSSTTPPTISGIMGSGSWTWISNGSGNGYYWSWSPGSPQDIPSGFHGGFVNPDSGTTGQQGQGTKPGPGTGGSFDTKPSQSTGDFTFIPGQQQGGVPVNPGQQPQGGSFETNPGQSSGGIPVTPGQQEGGVPIQTGQQGGSPQVQPGQQGGVPITPGQGGFPINPGQQGGFPQVQPGQQGGSFDQGGLPLNPQQPGGNVPIQGGDITQGGTQPQTGDKGQVPIKGPFGGSFDQSGKPISSGDIPSTQPGTQGSGNFPIQSGTQPQTGDQGQIPIKGPFGGSFDHTGKPIDSTGGSTTLNPSTGDQPGTKPGEQGQVPIQGPFGGSFDHTGKPIDTSGGLPVNPSTGRQPGTQPTDQGQPIKGSFGGSFDHTGKPIDTSGGVPFNPSTGDQPSTRPSDQGQAPVKGPFGGSFDQTGKPIDTSGGVPVNPSTGEQPSTQPIDQGQGSFKGPFGGSFDQTGKPIEAGGSTEGSHSSGGFPSTQPGTSGDLPIENPQTGATGSIPGTGDAGVIKGPFGGSFDRTGKPVDTTQPIQSGGSTSDQQSSGGVPVGQPGTAGETPLKPQTGGQGQGPPQGETEHIKGPFGGSFDHTGKPVDTSKPIEGGGSTTESQSSGGVPVQVPGTTGEKPLAPETSDEGTEEDIVKGPFGGSFDKGGKPIDPSSQGTYKCPPRSRIELFDAPTVPDASCPNSQDRRYITQNGKPFYILCCRHVDGGKKELAVIPDIPSLQYCIHICAGTAGCKSVLYTARQGFKSNYPLNTCQLFEHGDYDVQTPCNNDAHDSAYLIEPPTGTTGEIPPPPIAVDPPINPPISTPDVLPPHSVDIPPSFIMLPPGISEQCVQNVFAAIRCGTCASC